MIRVTSNITCSIVISELRFADGSAAQILLRPSARAKLMRLRVDPRSGALLLTVPKRVSARRAIAWAAQQQVWIETALARLPDPARLTPQTTIPLYGEPHRILWSEGAPRTVRRESGALRVGGPVETLRPRLLRWLRGHARDVLTEETLGYAAKAGVPVARITIGDPVSRWGSCSASGSIRYSWRLILAPDWVREATVAHEVAHLVHLNHGPAFHALVAELLGRDPRPARAWLRQHGAALQRFGGL